MWTITRGVLYVTSRRLRSRPYRCRIPPAAAARRPAAARCRAAALPVPPPQPRHLPPLATAAQRAAPSHAWLRVQLCVPSHDTVTMRQETLYLLLDLVMGTTLIMSTTGGVQMSRSLFADGTNDQVWPLGRFYRKRPECRESCTCCEPLGAGPSHTPVAA